MIRHSFRRSSGQPDAARPYDASDLTSARLAILEDAPDTLTGAAVAAMTDPEGIQVVTDVSFEIESNRLRRDFVEVTGYAADVATVPYVGSADLLATGRVNPARRYGIADTETGRLDDGAIAYDPTLTVDDSWAEDDKPATVFATSSSGATPIRAVGLAFNGDASLALPAPGARGRWLAGTFLGTPYTPTRVQVGAGSWMLDSYNNKPLPFRHAWRIEAPSGTLYAAGRRSFWAEVPNPVRYVIPPSGTRRFRAVCYVVAKDEALSVSIGAIFRFAGGGNSWPSGFRTQVPTRIDPLGPATKIVAELTVTGAPGAVIESIQPWIEIADVDDLGSGLEVSGVQVYAGTTARPDASGLVAASPATKLVVEERFYVDEALATPATRRIDRVDVSGELRASRITSAYVEVQEEAGGPWAYAGHGTGNGRLSIGLDRTYQATAVRVGVEETSSGEDGPIYLTEVDPRLVEDVSDDVVSYDVEWSRETDPGTATTPFGNYEATTLDLTLEDTDGRWNPARNASLDVGHRIEVAAGVRYSNVAPNPSLDTNADGWVEGFTGADVERVTIGNGLDDDAPRYAAATYGREDGGLFSITSPPVYSEPGAHRRIGLWVRVTGDPGATATLKGWGPLGSLTDVSGTDPVATDADGWIYLQADHVTSSETGFEYAADLIAVPGDLPGGGYGAVRVYATGVRSVVFDDGAARTQPRTFEELLPAGVFYSEPYDTASDSDTVTIPAVDRLARLQDAAVDEGVRVGHSLDRIVRDLALRFLDFDEDQLAIDAGSGSVVFPYAYPSGNLGSYLADLAKAAIASLHVDPLERLAISPRGAAGDEPVAEIRADNALIRHRRPPGYDVTTSIVTVNASPLVAAPVAELWAMPSGGLVIEPEGSVEIVATYSEVPAMNAYLHGFIADGATTISEASFYSDRAVIRVENPSTTQSRVIADLRVSGTPLVETPLAARREHAPSRRRYGPRELGIDARLIQTQGQVDLAAEALLDAFRAVDENGVRRLPDVEFDGLGLLHLTAGDRVILQDPEQALGSEYVVLGRKLSYSDGAFTLDGVRTREASSVRFAILDDSILDDVFVAGY